MFVVTSELELIPSDIPLVNEYQHVSLDDIATLSLEQEIEFSTDCILLV